MDEAPTANDTAPAPIGTAEDVRDRDREALERVAALLRELRYGTILLVVHDGEVVQIEAAQKIRLR